MLRLDRYILREALPIFGFGLALFVGLALVSNFLPRAQFFTQAEPLSLLKWLALQVPVALTQALPVGGLLAVMLTIGRLARENELLVMQAGGISLLRSARVFLVAGVALSGVSLALSEWVVPWANRAQVVVYWNELVPERTALFRLAGRELTVGDYVLRFDGYSPENKGQVSGVRLETWRGDTLGVILAQTARFEGDRLVLRDYRVFSLDLSKLPLPDFATLEQAQDHLQGLVRRTVVGDPGAELGITLSQTQQDLEARYAGGFEEFAPLSSWWGKLANPQAPPAERLEARAQFHSGLALSLANLLVLVLALPVAVRRATSPGSALALALVLTIAYYVAFSTGKVIALGSPVPELAAWGANLLGLAAGWWLGRGVYR